MVLDAKFDPSECIGYRAHIASSSIQLGFRRRCGGALLMGLAAMVNWL